MKRNAINDIVGGSVAGLIAVPEAMAYAVIIFTPLAVHRPDILPLGIISCVLTVAIANAVPVLFKGPRILISTPFSLASVMMAALATQIVASVTPQGGQPDLQVALALLIAVVFVSGLIQVLLGLLRLGDLAKYMPMPVIAGLRNGAAVVIVMSQLRPLLGLDDDAPLSVVAILWPTLAVGLVSFVVMWQGHRLTARIPGAVLAIVVGTSLYYVLSLSGAGAGLTTVVGTIPSALPTPQFADDLLAIITTPSTRELFLGLLPAALALAILNTLQTLVAVVTADNLAESRSRSNRELVGQGLGNTVCGLFGAMSASGAVGGTLANFGSGGRGTLSRLAAAGLALAVILFLGPLIAYLPQIVLAGALIALALSMVDRPSLRLLTDTLRRRVSARETVKDLSVIATVMIILLTLGPLHAVGAGVIVALVYFLLRMSSDNVRREFTADNIRSHVHRNFDEYQALRELGKRIHVMELEGPLFFGTSDRLANRIEEQSKHDVEFIILDFSRASEIDTTAVSLICQARKACMNNGTTLILCALQNRPVLAAFLQTTPIYDVFGEQHIHTTLNDGLAYVEDLLLDRRFAPGRYQRELAPEQVDCLAAIGVEHITVLMPYLRRHEFADEDEVFAQGVEADAMYFVLKGQAAIVLHAEDGPPHTIGIVCPGGIFGEMAVLDGKPRSASIIATGELTCLALTLDRLQALASAHPATLQALMVVIGLELSKRIRISNRALRALRNTT